jgi:hypothetical protein
MIIPLTRTGIVQFLISYEKIKGKRIDFYNEYILIPKTYRDHYTIYFDRTDYYHRFWLKEPMKRIDFIKWIYDLYETMNLNGEVLLTGFVLHNIYIENNKIYINGKKNN